jgi:hypothetical protein
MSDCGQLRHVTARSLTVAFGGQSGPWGARLSSRPKTDGSALVLNLNLRIFSAWTVRRPNGRTGSLPTLGEASDLLGPDVFARFTTCKNSCEQIRCFSAAVHGSSTPAEPLHQRLPNGTGEASGGRPKGPTVWRSGQRQVHVAALIGLSPGWPKS